MFNTMEKLLESAVYFIGTFFKQPKKNYEAIKAVVKQNGRK